MKIVRFIGVLLFVATFTLFGCKSKIDEAIENIAPYEKYFMGDVMKVDSLPVGFEKKLADFVKEFKQYSKSSKYIYAAAYLAEKRGKIREAADYAALYVDDYASEKSHRMESAMVAAHYYETMGKYELALKYYDLISKEYPKNPVGEQAKFTSEMIRKGAITPEQQLEYMQLKIAADSSKN
jgi:tetratricopeptide (TPR) repeat protein